MTELDRLHGTLIFPYTEQIHDIFLKSFIIKKYTMMKNEKEIDTGQISTKLRELLTKKGYKFPEKNATFFTGKKKVFDCRVEVNKIVDKHNRIRQLNIKVPGQTMEEVRNNVKKIKESVKTLVNIEPEVKIWDRLEDC